MTNFERAYARMRAQGYRPFTPYATGPAARRQSQPITAQSREPAALRIDVVIAAVAVFVGGVALGMLIG